MSTQAVIPFDVTAQKVAAAKLVEGVGLQSLNLAAQQIVVSDDESYAQCIGLMGRFGDAKKRILDFWEPLAKSAHGLHKLITSAREEMSGPYATGELICKRKAESYQDECRAAKRRAEQQMALAAEEERQRLVDQSRDLLAMGFVAKAEQLERQASMTTGVVLPEAVSRVAGARVGTKCEWTVTDLVALMRAVVDGEIPLMHTVKGELRPLLMVDPVVMNSIVDRFQMTLKWPGVVVEEKSKISRSGK
jgi:hypothetical protein